MWISQKQFMGLKKRISALEQAEQERKKEKKSEKELIIARKLLRPTGR